MNILEDNYKKQNEFSSPKLFKYYCYLLCITILLFIPCLFFHLDEIVIATGEIRPENKEASVKTLFSGFVTNISFTNSQFINKGDLLFEMDAAYEKKELENLEKLKLLYEIEENELSDLLNLIDQTNIKSLPIDTNSKYNNTKCLTFISQYESYKKNIEITENNYLRQKTLYPISVSKSEIEECENQFLQAKYTFSSWFGNQKILVQEEFSEITEKLQNIQERIIQTNKAIENSKIHAPISGYINDINKICNGDYLYSGTEILTIIPITNNIKCIANISSSNISKIKIGQEVIVQIDDLPWTKYGKLIGKVSLIPSDVKKSIELSGGNFFPVEIQLSQNYLQDRKKEKVFLHIGSSANVKIKVSKNTIFQKFLQSLVLND